MTSEVKKRKRKLLAWILSVALAVGGWQGNQLVARAEAKTVKVYLNNSTVPDGVVSSGDSFAGYPGYPVTVGTDADGNYTVGPVTGNNGKNRVISWTAADSGGYAIASDAGIQLQVSSGDAFDQAFNDKYGSMGVLGNWGKYVEVNFYTDESKSDSVLYERQYFIQTTEDETFTVMLPREEPIKENYFFDKWSLSKDSTIYNLQIAEDRTFPTEILESDVSGITYTSADTNEDGIGIPDLLYYDYVAQWVTPGTVTVTFQVDGGTLNGEKSVTCTQESKSQSSCNVTLPGADPSTENTGKLLKWQDQYGCGGYAPGESFTIYFETGKDNSMPMTGIWVKPLTASVSYNLAGGTMTDVPQTETIAQTSCNQWSYTVTMPEGIPTKEGYLFDGWYKESNNETDPTLYAPKQVVEKMDFYADPSPVFTAQWSPAMAATVNYHPDGGTYNGISEVSSETIYQPTHDATKYEIKVSNTKPVRDGYFFTGWLCSVDKQTYQPGSTISELYYKEHANVTLTAQWTAVQTATVEYDTDGGSVEIDNKATVSAAQAFPGETSFQIQLPVKAPTKTHAFFDYWEYSVDGEKQADVTVSAGDNVTVNYGPEDVTAVVFTAVYTDALTATVGYDAGDGTYGGEATETIYQTERNTQIYEIQVSETEPTQAGYFFAGWLCSADGKTYQPGSSISGLNYKEHAKVTLTAQWSTVKTATVSYDAGTDGEVVLDGNTTQSATQPDLKTGSFLVQVPAEAPTKTHAFFDYWEYSVDGVKQTGQIPAGGTVTVNYGAKDVTTVAFTAVYTDALSAVVSYEVDGQAYDEAPDETIYQEIRETQAYQVQVSAAEPTKDDYFFAGWLCSADGKTYQPGSAISGLNYKEHAKVTLTAQWSTVKTATVTYDAGTDGKVVLDVKTTQGATQPDLATGSFQVQMPAEAPTKTYAFFDYWEYSVDGVKQTGQIPAGGTVMVNYGAKDVTTVAFTAVYTDALTATVSYDGVLTETIYQPTLDTVGYEIRVAEVQPTKDGYFFTGWLCSADLKTYLAGATISGLTYTDMPNVELTAQWSTVKTATVSYDAGTDGKVVLDEKTTQGATQPDLATGSFQVQMPAEAPTKTHAFFDYWEYSVDGVKQTGQLLAGGTVTVNYGAKDVTTVAFTAVYTDALTATVSYDGVLTETIYQPTRDTVGYEIQVAEVQPTKDGYFFTGWLCSADLKTYLAGATISGLTYTDMPNVELTAQWSTVKTATVTYDAGTDGKVELDDKTTQSATQPDLATGNFQVQMPAEAPTKTHAFFDYWEYSVNGEKQTGQISAGETVTVKYGAKDVTAVEFTAVYTKALTATVSYDADDGTYDGEATETIYQTERDNQIYEIQVSETEPTKAGYFFAGWLCSADGQIYQSENTINGLAYDDYPSVTLTAQWSTVKTATVTYDAGTDGKVVLDDKTTRSAPQPDLATSSFQVQLPAEAPTKLHAFFDYWEYSVDGVKQTGQISAGGTVTANYGAENVTIVKFTAVYTNALTATVTYEPAEGIYDGALTETVYQSAKDTKQYQIQVSQTKPMRDGYSFAGWLCSADGKTYQPGETISELDYGNVSKVILTAQWTIAPSLPNDQPNVTEEQEENTDAVPEEVPPALLQSTVTLNLDGGSYTGTTSFQKIQQNSGELLFTQVLPQEIPVKENAYFDGWLCSANAYVYGPGEEVRFAYANVRNVVFTAQWIQDIGEGTVYLEKGAKYHLKSGTWTISGDSSVYSGNINFYVAEDGYYTINKGRE